MSKQTKCNTCGRIDLDNDANWLREVQKGRIVSSKCPSCMSIDEFASAAYEAESHGFIYDPVTNRTYARPRDVKLPRITLGCPCGLVISDSGDDVQEMFDEHRATCAEGGDDRE